MSDSPERGRSGGEQDDLRREMESHLRELEQDARHGGASRAEATRAAEDKFGDAVTHFRQSLAAMDRRQSHLRSAVIALAFAALVVTAAGIIVNLRTLDDLRATIEAWSARADPVEPDFSHARYPAVLLELQWASQFGPVGQDFPILRTEWETIAGGVVPVCASGEWPVLSFAVEDVTVAGTLQVPVGTRITCTPRSLFDVRSYTGTHPLPDAERLRGSFRGAAKVGCVPVPRDRR